LAYKEVTPLIVQPVYSRPDYAGFKEGIVQLAATVKVIAHFTVFCIICSLYIILPSRCFPIYDIKTIDTLITQGYNKVMGTGNISDTRH